MEKEKLERISWLSRESRTRKLTSDELKEQKALREEYLESIRKNFRSVLDNIELK